MAWITVVALIVGPLLAVALTLWREERRELRDRKMSVMRQLLVVKEHPKDPAFSSAINLIPIEFAKCDDVMTALEAFTHAAAGKKMTDDIKNELLAAMMIELGFGRRAAKQTSRVAYVAQGLASQRELNEQVAQSLISLATSGRRSADASEAMAKRLLDGQPMKTLEGVPDQQKLV
jgi:hypothetical protein